MTCVVAAMRPVRTSRPDPRPLPGPMLDSPRLTIPARRAAPVVEDVRPTDAVQEAFFSAYRNLGSFRGGSVRSWLSRIAINAAMDQQRLRKRRPSQPYPELEDESWQPPAGPEADPERTAVTHERSRVLSRALAAITPDQRHAIVLFDVEGYDYAEIAELTGVSLGTVKSRIHRGRLALRDLLEPSITLFRGEAG